VLCSIASLCPHARVNATRKNIMRPSIKVSLTGLLIAGAWAFSAVGADAMAGNSNGRDAFIGIIDGGCTGSPKGGGRYNACPFNNPGRDAHGNGQGGYGGNGAYGGGPNH
jgi:hypothetical protein